ncbi:MAG: hypothetical protein HYV26_24535 [Candidatus Hydrogenedentes bacterium]|nr:hypothetical protein [Candidatus Hydrogenedentota bacterium]
MGNSKQVKAIPAPALQIQIILEVILQFLNVLQAIERVFGINFGGND